MSKEEIGRKEGENALSWETEEYVHQEKSSDWFWALGIIALAGSTAAILLGNLLFALVIALGASVVALFAARKPLPVTVALVKKGVLIGARLYPYASIRSFWVNTEHTPPTLFLELKNPLLHQLKIPIEESISPDDIRLFLLKHAEEHEQENDSLIERVAERLGF